MESPVIGGCGGLVALELILGDGGHDRMGMGIRCGINWLGRDVPGGLWWVGFHGCGWVLAFARGCWGFGLILRDCMFAVTFS